jgi:hypothetical protein
MTTLTRTEMLSDLAQLGINGLDKVADKGVQAMHYRFFPEKTDAKSCKDSCPFPMCMGSGTCPLFFIKITPEQVEDAIDAVTLPQIARKEE